MNAASTDSTLVEYEISDGIGILTLNNPRRRNALSTEVLQTLKGHLDEIPKSADVRVVIIRATGPVFSSGHDLGELLQGDEEEHAALFHLCTTSMEKIRLMPQPVIDAFGNLYVMEAGPTSSARSRGFCRPCPAFRQTPARTARTSVRDFSLVPSQPSLA